MFENQKKTTVSKCTCLLIEINDRINWPIRISDDKFLDAKERNKSEHYLNQK